MPTLCPTRVSRFKNFGNFNKGFTPLGSRALKSLFLGTSALDGEYLYGLTKRCAEVAQAESSAFLEPRYSVYGNNPTGWRALAKWVRKWKVDETTTTLLAVQLPRVYPVWKKLGMVQSFGEMLRNFFDPLFAAARHNAENPIQDPDAITDDVAWLLPRLRLLDTVDDESKPDLFEVGGLPPPDDWTGPDNPSWAYYHFHSESFFPFI